MHNLVRRASHNRLASALLCIGTLSCVPLATAADDAIAERLANMPPLIDRNVFFGDPEVSGAQLSPDGKWISFRKPLLSQESCCVVV